ncbi:MAG: YHS domain-containing protein [Gammaproteobacteria bacterium]|nr:YHS domain-containing protein [Gammaproteobacteria bacterium]
MEGFFSFLLFAGLFYLMMRVGCGAHMMHGHHGASDENSSKHIDPVCAKNVPPNEGYGKMHEGRLYRFCSRKCLDAFDQNPERYLPESSEAMS